VILIPEHVDSMYLQNVGTHLPVAGIAELLEQLTVGLDDVGIESWG